MADDGDRLQLRQQGAEGWAADPLLQPAAAIVAAGLLPKAQADRLHKVGEETLVRVQCGGARVHAVVETPLVACGWARLWHRSRRGLARAPSQLEQMADDSGERSPDVPRPLSAVDRA
eukprot:3761249-Pyramimonas_sp.AAC.1